jgi:hypothetical protein
VALGRQAGPDFADLACLPTDSQGALDLPCFNGRSLLLSLEGWQTRRGVTRQAAHAGQVPGMWGEASGEVPLLWLNVQ